MDLHHILTRRIRLALAAAAFGTMALTGCAPAVNTPAAPPQSDKSGAQGSPGGAASPSSPAAERGDTGKNPSSFPTEIPVLPYEITFERGNKEAGEYRLRMRGTDARADAEKARAQLVDAGFEEVGWSELNVNDKSTRGGTFERDKFTVALTVRGTNEGVEIEYNATDQGRPGGG